MRRRIVITGLGAVTAAGIGTKAFWHALRNGLSGLDTLTRFDPSPFTCRVAGEAREFDPRLHMRAKTAGRINRFSQLGLAAARMAYEDADLAADPRASRFSVCFGSSLTAAAEYQGVIERLTGAGLARLSPGSVLESIGSAVTNWIAAELDLSGQTMTLGSGCASGLDSVQWACNEIQDGRATGVVAGATDAPLATAIYGTWSTLGWLSRWPGPPAQALRPFDAMSTGTVLGEGSGAFVLEDLEHARARGARMYAEILGCGTGSEGLHLGPADPTRTSLEQAVRAALRAARLDPSEIDYVSTHGGGIPSNDRAETATYRSVFGRHAYNMPVTSIKPITGNAFAAGGALQVVAACFTLAEQSVPGTLNLDIPDPACDLDYVPGTGRPARVRRLMVTTRAIGPTYSAVVFAPPPPV
jgi:3-oxoacyl-[acyl-carrier-protein] synthase II